MNREELYKALMNKLGYKDLITKVVLAIYRLREVVAYKRQDEFVNAYADANFYLGMISEMYKIDDGDIIDAITEKNKLMKEFIGENNEKR